MAAALKEEHLLAQKLYIALQAASCPLVVKGHVGEDQSAHQLLSTPSEHRTNILAWVCTSIKPNHKNVKSAMEPNDPNVLDKEMAMLGQELMQCKMDDLELIQGHAKPLRQLLFLKELLAYVPGCESLDETASLPVDGGALLMKLFAEKNRAHIINMLSPTFDLWPAHISKQNQSRQGPVKSDNVVSLLESSRRVLKELLSECEFLHGECKTPAVFYPCALHVAVSDLRQLTAAFSHIYEMDFKDYCQRKAPQLRTDHLLFRRVHRLLLVCNTKLKEIEVAAQASATEAATKCQPQTCRCYWSYGGKRPLADKLEELTRRYKRFLSQPSAD